MRGLLGGAFGRVHGGSRRDCSIAVIRGSGGFFNDRLLVVTGVCMVGLM